MSDIANLGFSVDTKALKKGEKALDDFATTGEKTERRTDASSKKIVDDIESVAQATKRTAAEQAKAEKKMANFSRASGQAGIQFQQFIGQVQGGQGVMLALSQQSADLGFVLGAPLLGAIAGISASLVGMLLPSLLSVNEEVENLSKNTDQLISSLDKLTKEQRLVAQQGLQERLKEQTKGFGDLHNEIIDLERTLRASKFLKSQGGILEFFSDPDESLNELVAAKIAMTALGLEVEKTAGQIRDLSSISGNESKIDETIKALQEQANLYGANERAVALYKSAVDGASVSQLSQISSTFDLIDAKKEEIEATKESAYLNQSITDIADSIEKQVIALRDGTSASLEFTVAKRLGLAEDEKIPQVIQKQINALKKLQEAKEKAKTTKKEDKDQSKSLESLTKRVEGFGGAWSKSGSLIVDTFGDMSDALGDYMDRVKEIGKLEKEVGEKRIALGDDNEKVISLQTKLDEEKVSAELAGMKSIASATGGLFDEKTAASKAFAALNKMITVAEIAMAFQRMTVSKVETASTVADNTVKQSSNALTAVTAAFSAPFPIGFVAGAAMIAIMASLLGGSSSGGGGGGGGGKPSGSVLGGGDNESIINSQDRLEDIQLAQLDELKGIRSGLSAAEDAVNGIAAGVFSGDFAKDTGEGFNAIFGMIFERQAITKELRGVFDTIANTSIEAIDNLGLNRSGNQDSFIASFKGLDFELEGDELIENFNAVLGEQSDLFVGTISKDINELRKIGEGAFETLVRVSSEQAFFNDNLDKFGFSLTGLSKIMQIDVAQSLINLTGGFENFSDFTDSFVSNFFTEAEQFSHLEQSLTDVFDSLDLSVSTSKEEFRALIAGIDVTTQEGRELVATLLEINPTLSEYIEELERIESKRTSMTIELLELQGEAEQALALEREIELENTEELLQATQLLIFAEEDRLALLDKQEEAARDAFSMIEKSINLEKQRAQAILDTANTAHQAELDRVSLLRATLEDDNTLKNSALSDAEAALNSSFNSEIKSINDRAKEEIKAANDIANARINSLKDERKAVSDTASSMRKLISDVSNSVGLQSGTLKEALTAAMAGDFSIAKTLDIRSLSKLDAGNFSSAQELRVQEAINQNRLKALSELASTQLTESETLLDSIDAQSAAAKLSSDNQIIAINEQANAQVLQLQDQLNTLLDIDDSVLSLNDAIVQFQDAQLAVDELNYEQQSTQLDKLITSADDVLALHEQAYQDEIERLDSIADSSESLLNAALDIDDSVHLLADAVIMFNASASMLTTSDNRAALFALKDLTGAELAALRLEAVKEREANDIYMRQLIKNTKKSAELLQRFELNGLDTNPTVS